MYLQARRLQIQFSTFPELPDVPEASMRAGVLGPAPRCTTLQTSSRCVSAAQLSSSAAVSLSTALVLQLQTHLLTCTVCALTSGFAAAGAQQQALPPAPRCTTLQTSSRCVSAAQLSSSAAVSLSTALVLQLQTHLLTCTVCALTSGFAAAGAQQQALPPAAAIDAPLRHVTMRNKGSAVLREATHMQPAAMELLGEMQKALGS